MFKIAIKNYIGRGGSFSGKTKLNSKRWAHPGTVTGQPGIVAGLPELGYKARLGGV